MARNRRTWVVRVIYLLLPVMLGSLAISTDLRGEEPSARDLLSVSFYESDIRQALLGLAMNRDVNVTMTPEVSGKVTVNLHRMTLDEALSAIAASGGFDCRKEKGVYLVYRPKDKPEDKPENKPKEKVDSPTDSLQIRIFKLKFAKTDKVQEILSSIPGIRLVRTHDQTRTIIVEDTPANIAKIETMINAWDEPPKQVLIEAKILEVELRDDMKLGVDWSKVMGSATVTTGSNFSGNAMGGVFGAVRTGVGTTHELTAAIAALESRTRINTLSTPKILAVHGTPAKVQVGGKTGYKTTVTNQGVTTEQIQFIDTGIILDITVYISNEGNILMNVQPQVSSASVDAVTQVPTVTTTTVLTSLLTKSGQTVFIGGLMKNVISKERQAVPLLGSIPVVGALFGWSHPRVEKTETIILITPHLLEEAINSTTTDAIERIDKVNEASQKRSGSMYRELVP